MTNPPLIQVQASSTFNRNLRNLAKKYRRIRHDIQPVIAQLEKGELLGDQISGIVIKMTQRSLWAHLRVFGIKTRAGDGVTFSAYIN